MPQVVLGVLGVVGGAVAGVLAVVAPDGWRTLLVLDAVVSWVAAVVLAVRPQSSPGWRRVGRGWAVALPAAYVVAQWASP